MKKLLSILLVLCMLFALCACGKCKEAKTADDLILAIGEVNLDSETNVLAAVTYSPSSGQLLFWTITTARTVFQIKSAI